MWVILAIYLTSLYKRFKFILHIVLFMSTHTHTHTILLTEKVRTRSHTHQNKYLHQIPNILITIYWVTLCRALQYWFYFNLEVLKIYWTYCKVFYSRVNEQVDTEKVIVKVYILYNFQKHVLAHKSIHERIWNSGRVMWTANTCNCKSTIRQ